MRNFSSHRRIFVLTVALAAGGAALVRPASAETPAPEAQAVKPDLDKVNQHLTRHQSYPATRAQLLASCKGLVDFSPAEKRWFADHLAEGTYQSAAEVMKSLNRK
ncbi:MAG TPA: hypothetical protein VHH90_04455 [Polyangia bacterium]|nr:hypothetical protein [Polyangia bacterium]